MASLVSCLIYSKSDYRYDERFLKLCSVCFLNPLKFLSKSSIFYEIYFISFDNYLKDESGID